MNLLHTRRFLHQIPETGLETKKTRLFLEELLSRTGARILHPLPESLALFYDAGQEETICLRSDMDGLPGRETTGLPFASANGRQHACGHDGHMTMLAGAAIWLGQALREGLPLSRNILILFQPGEENPGGAEPILASGLFENLNVREIYGMHIFPGLPAGHIVTRPGPMMSGACNFVVEARGLSSHQAMPDKGINALHALAAFIAETREEEAAALADSPEMHILGYGRLDCGQAPNIIPDYGELEGTIRYYDPAVFETIWSILTRKAAELEERSGARLSLRVHQHYPPVINDEVLSASVPNAGRLEEPVLIAEDFSFYQRQVPGVFFFIGSGRDVPLHNSAFDFDESLLEAGQNFWIERILAYRTSPD